MKNEGFGETLRFNAMLLGIGLHAFFQFQDRKETTINVEAVGTALHAVNVEAVGTGLHAVVENAQKQIPQR